MMSIHTLTERMIAESVDRDYQTGSDEVSQ